MSTTIDKSSLSSIDFSSVIPYMSWNQTSTEYLKGPAGQEPYRFISAMAAVLKNPETAMVDIGTYMGASALSLALDNQQPVVTYDIMDWVGGANSAIGQYTFKDKSNITFKIMDCRNTVEMKTILSKAPLIVLDIDPHNGIEEKQIIKDLEHFGFKGALILDDIHLNPEMEEFWNGLSQTHKKDVTLLGHWSGTGLVYFDENLKEKITLNT